MSPQRERLIELLPNSVAVLRDLQALPPLPDIEAAAVRSAAPARRTQFAAARSAARTALLKLGASPQAIPRADSGAPLWPAGIVGSLAHSEHWALACVAQSGHWQALGVDIEPRAPLTAEARDYVLTASERESSGEQGRLLFCAKECLHKCLHPLSGLTLEFDEVAVQLRGAGFDYRPLSDRAQRLLQGLSLRSRYLDYEGNWLLALGLAP